MAGPFLRLCLGSAEPDEIGINLRVALDNGEQMGLLRDEHGRARVRAGGAGESRAATSLTGTLSDAIATAKQEVRKVLDGLPEETSLEDIQYHLYVLQRIQRGREDVEAGRVVPHDDAERRLARWLDE